MSYEEFFQLKEQPFSNTPDSRFYFESQQHSEAMVRLLHAVQTMKGLAILVGDVGTGKTHVAVSLGVCACRQGKRVRFYTAAGLINELVEAQAENRLSKLQAQLLKQDLIILDEVGFIPFSPAGAQLLFQLCSARHERGSLLITTNLSFADWTQVFGDERLTAALLDRLTFHSHIVEFRGESYRFKQSLKAHQDSA